MTLEEGHLTTLKGASAGAEGKNPVTFLMISLR